MAAEVLDTAPEIQVVRSARRRRTISAYRSGGRIIVQVPARLSRAEEARWVDRMVRRVLAGERRVLWRGGGAVGCAAPPVAGRFSGGGGAQGRPLGGHTGRRGGVGAPP